MPIPWAYTSPRYVDPLHADDSPCTIQEGVICWPHRQDVRRNGGRLVTQAMAGIQEK